MMTAEQIKKEIEGIFDEVAAMRRHLHMYPELSNEEQKTMEYISEKLTEMRIENVTNVGGHGVVAVIGNPEKGKTIGIRADIDALPIEEMNDFEYKSTVPGVMHACGHDLHTATLLGAAKIFKAHEGEMNGAVKLFFQPAEEKGGGAKYMIADGYMKNPDVSNMLGYHIVPDKPVGLLEFARKQSNASSSGVKVRIYGQSAHGSTPQNGVDAVVVAAQVINNLQTVVSRMVAPTDPAVLTFGTIHGGSKSNIIADFVELDGTIRTYSLKVRDQIREKASMIVNSTAAASGARAEITFGDGYPPIINDPQTVDKMVALAEEILGKDSYVMRDVPTMGGEDFSFFANEVPSCYFKVGTTDGSSSHRQKLHNEWLAPSENAMKNAILMEVMGAQRLMEE